MIRAAVDVYARAIQERCAAGSSMGSGGTYREAIKRLEQANRNEREARERLLSLVDEVLGG